MKNKNIIIGKNGLIENEKIFENVDPTAEVKIGDNVKIYSYANFTLKKNSKISIGDNTIISGAIFLVNKEIKIGKNVVLSYYVTIIDSDFHSTDPIIRKKETFEFAPPTNHDYFSPDIKNEAVIIEDDVWIGAHALILKGVRVGKGARIAAGSVVTKDVPANAYVEGNPGNIMDKKDE